MAIDKLKINYKAHKSNLAQSAN